MKRKTRLLFAAALLGATFGTTAAGCDLFKGNFALTDFVVNTEGADLEYLVNETVDFSGLVMTATYNDNSAESVAITSVKFYLNDVDITANLNEITKTKGEKTIVVVYTTEHGEDSTSFKVTVTENVQEEQVIIDSLSAPYFYLEYKNAIATATNADGVENEGKFYKNEGQEYYIVGNENAFKYLPIATTLDEETLLEVTLDNFVAQSTISVLDNGQYTELTKGNKEGEEYVYEYKLGNDLIVTENAAKNEYSFTSVAVDKIFKISVKPNETIYDTTVKSKEIEVQVKQAYNIYNASQTAVLDNSNRTEWNALKNANGVASVSKTIKGVVFHADIKITKDNIPEGFQYTLPADHQIVYKDLGNNTTGSPEDFGLERTFLWNQYCGSDLDLFERNIVQGDSFAFYGNYFALDTSAMPLVASFASAATPSTPGATGDTFYGEDFSNTTLFKFSGDLTTTDNADERYSFNNLNIKGNAKSVQLVITDGTDGFQGTESLVYCGSLIFIKTSASTMNFDNCRMQNFFIGLFPDEDGVINYSRVKCYDSAQTAMFAWGAKRVNIENSRLERSGGPLIISQHAHPDWEGEWTNKYANIVVSADTKLESRLLGSEAWFKAIPGATDFVAQFATMNTQILVPMGKSIFDADNKMNIVTLIFSSTSNVMQAIGELRAQGSFVYGNAALDRRVEGSELCAKVRQVFALLGANAAQIPIFNIGNEVFFVNPLIGNGTIVSVADPTTDATMQMYMAMATADYIGLTQGGLSILLALTPVSQPQ